MEIFKQGVVCRLFLGVGVIPLLLKSKKGFRVNSLAEVCHKTLAAGIDRRDEPDLSGPGKLSVKTQFLSGFAAARAVKTSSKADCLFCCGRNDGRFFGPYS